MDVKDSCYHTRKTFYFFSNKEAQIMGRTLSLQFHIMLSSNPPMYCMSHTYSDFIRDSRKLPVPSHLGKSFIKIGKISAKIHEIGKIKAIFGLEMTPT